MYLLPGGFRAAGATCGGHFFLSLSVVSIKGCLTVGCALFFSVYLMSSMLEMIYVNEIPSARFPSFLIISIDFSALVDCYAGTYIRECNIRMQRCMQGHDCSCQPCPEDGFLPWKDGVQLRTLQGAQGTLDTDFVLYTAVSPFAVLPF
jgi:hypothetical protein